MATILSDGGKGIGVNPRGDNFPFIAPSDDVRDILADAYLAHAIRDVVPPLRLTRLTGFGSAFDGGAARCDVEVRDAAGTVLFDSTLAVRYRAYWYGTRLRVHEWYAPAVVCRVVQHAAWPEAAAVRIIPDLIEPEDGRLDERVGQLLARRANLVRDPETGTTVAGDLTCANGYNTTIVVTAVKRGLRVITQLTWAADAGAGLGRYPGCVEPDLVLRTINRRRPAADGDFQLGAEGCYWVRRPTARAGVPPVSVPEEATLHLGNDCGPCCECDDFVRVQRGILRTWDKFKATAAEAEATRDVFKAVVARWEEERACIDAKVVSVALAAYAGQYVEVIVGICNHTRNCLYDTTLTLTIADAPGPGTIPRWATQINVPGRGMIAYDMAGAWPSYTAYFDAIQAMSSGALRTRFQIPSATTGRAVTVRAHAATTRPLAGLQLPQETAATATFE